MDTYAILGTIIGIVIGIIFFFLFCKEMSEKSIRNRMELPSVDQIAIMWSTEGSMNTHYCLANFCPKCLTTSPFHEDCCSKCGTRIISARPFKTCKICLTEQSCGKHCKICGAKLEEYQYIRDRIKENPHRILGPRIFKLNPEYKEELESIPEEEVLKTRKRPMFSETRWTEHN